jgi:multiple sugar transport system permease protein
MATISTNAPPDTAPPEATHRRAWLTFARRNALVGYLLIAPVILTLLALVAYPLGFAVWIAFTDRVVGRAGEFVGFRNFDYLLGWSSFTRAVTNTLVLVAVTGVLKLILGLGLALIVNENIRGRGFFRAVLLLPWAMPAFVVFLTWRVLFQPLGGGLNLLITEAGLMPLFEWVGIAQRGYIDWLGERAMALPSVILASTWRGFPFWFIVLLAALQGIPGDLYEAAKLDGASRFRRFMDVTLPGIRNSIFIVVLMSSIWTANSFEHVWILTQGGPSDATMVLPVLSYFGLQNQRLGEAAAVSVAMLPALLLMVIVTTRLIEEDD